MIRRLALGLMSAALAAPVVASEPGGNFYDHSFTSIDGGPLDTNNFRGQPILVVNTASFCGFTPQYEGLQALYDRYRERGLVVLGVPSGDFGGQEYGSNDEIKDFCEVNFSINFPMTAKVHVRGQNAHPFYQWAAAELGSETAPRWNFHKYLIDGDGRLAGWYPTTTRPDSAEIIDAIERELARSVNAS